jgi:Tol biopolymer transport system component
MAGLRPAREHSAHQLTDVSRKLIAGAAASLCSLAGCTDALSPPSTVATPAFVYVSDQTGRDRLIIYDHGATAPFPGTLDGDADPQSAHGRIVFSGHRVSETSSEIYGAKLDGSDLQRLTTGALDIEPSMSPDGNAVAFVRLQSGVSRLWMVQADGSNAAAISTGSDSHTPESSPRLSPDGRSILFNSSRSGTSQLWQLPAGGGAAVQLSHETNGAFNGSWGADGSSVFFVAGLDFHTVHEIAPRDGAETSIGVDGSAVAEPECSASLCLAATNSDDASGDIVVIARAGSSAPLSLVSTAANEREPAFLHP